jgi:hypothetical protein
MSQELDETKQAIVGLKHAVLGTDERNLRQTVLAVAEGLVRSVEALERSQFLLEVRLKALELQR